MLRVVCLALTFSFCAGTGDGARRTGGSAGTGEVVVEGAEGGDFGGGFWLFELWAEGGDGLAEDALREAEAGGSDGEARAGGESTRTLRRFDIFGLGGGWAKAGGVGGTEGAGSGGTGGTSCIRACMSSVASLPSPRMASRGKLKPLRCKDWSCSSGRGRRAVDGRRCKHGTRQLSDTYLTFCPSVAKRRRRRDNDAIRT